MERRDDWQLFLATGLPQAYTYLKARERTAPQTTKGPDGKTHRD